MCQFPLKRVILDKGRWEVKGVLTYWHTFFYVKIFTLEQRHTYSDHCDLAWSATGQPGLSSSKVAGPALTQLHQLQSVMIRKNHLYCKLIKFLRPTRAKT